MNRLIALIILLITALSVHNTVTAQTPIPSRHSQTHDLLLAKQQNIQNEINLIDSISFRKLLEEEDLKYPAWDLYGEIWDQEWVNPYKKKPYEVPDTVDIDVSKYYIPVPGQVTSGYGPRGRRHRMHRGVDLRLQIGDTVRAAFDGRVRLKKYERRGYGYYVIIRHTNGLETIYGHLSKFLVEPDQIVRAGDPIALGGNTGRSTGPHLHFETRYLGLDFDPRAIFDFKHQTTYSDLFTFTPKKVAKGYTVMTVNGKTYTAYRIRRGDTLSGIAQQNRTSVRTLCRLNNITTKTVLKPGKLLRLP